MSPAADQFHVDSFVIVNLVEEHIDQTAVFFLSENTVAGVDKYETEQSFVVDPNSNLMATATRWGSVYIGETTYDGVKDYNHKIETDLAFSLASMAPSSVFAAVIQVLELVDHEKDPGDAPRPKFKGTTLWPNPNVIAVGVAAIMMYLIHKDYSVTFQTDKLSVYFHLSPKKDQGDGAVPAKVKKDWDDAVAQGKKYRVENKGIVEEK